jgi:hypothetical protein
MKILIILEETTGRHVFFKGHQKTGSGESLTNGQIQGDGPAVANMIL